MPSPPRPHKSLFRSLGEFVGHIAKAVKTDPARPPAPAAPAPPPSDSTVIRHETTESQSTTPDGRPITLRRTIIEEIDLPPDQPRP